MPQSAAFTVNLELALSGKGAVPQGGYDQALAKSAAALDWLRQQHASKGLELLGIPSRTDDLRAAAKQAAALKGFATVAVLGIGGSSLGGQALSALRKVQKPFVEFHDNPDPFHWAKALKRFDLKKTHFIAISKSGGTAETLMQVLTAAEALEKRGVKQLKKHFTIVTEPHASALADFADSIGAVKLDHPLGVGGRYSVLTNVGLLPAAVVGLDITAIRGGAGVALAPVLANRPPAEVPAAVGAALAVTLGATKPMSVMLAYADRLERFTRWYVQLWAESLGKDGKGTTPIAALGPVDQHSQLQLYLAGPRDKLFTIVTVSAAGRGPRIADDLARLSGEPDFAGKTIGDLVAAQGRATAETLAKNGCPVRTIHIDTLDEASLGELLMHFMLETIIAAHLMGVDPFDQPAVEEGKVLAKRYLMSQ